MEALEGFSQRLGLYDIGMHMTRKLRLERLVGPWRVLFLHVQIYGIFLPKKYIYME